MIGKGYSRHMALKMCTLLQVIALSLTGTFAAAQTRDLDYYINYALSNSPLLKDLHNQEEINRLDSIRLRATYRPLVQALSNNSYAPTIGGWGYDAALTNIGSFTTVAEASKTFVGRNNLKTQLYSYHLTNDSLLFASKMSEQELKRTVIAQYITAYGGQQQVRFDQNITYLLGEQDAILNKLTQSNVYRQTDYLAFLVTYRQQQLTLKQQRIQYEADLETLNYLCGLYDTTIVPLDSPVISVQHLADEYESAFFLRYRADSMKLKNSIALVNYSYHPKFTAFANAGYSSSQFYFTGKNLGFSFGLNASMPIYDGHQRQLQIRKINLQQYTTVAYRDFFRNQYYQQVAMLKRQLRATEQLVTDIREQERYAKGLIEVNVKLMQTGDARIAEYVLALNNYLTARNLLTQNSVSRMQIINQINYWNR